MSRMLQYGEPRAVAIHRVWLCLLLAGLFLYNPFLVGPDSFGGLNLRHPPSNRATIGSSELQQFNVANEGRTIAAPESAEVKSPVSLPDRAELTSAPSPEKVSLPQQFLCASLRFRPPPAS